MITRKNAKEKFVKQQELYERLGTNLEQAIQSFLKFENISHLNVYHRTKDFNSFYEKIERKKYKDPFKEVEDICGLRIICYYISDIEKIEDIIKKEFNVLETQDKSESLGLKEFAYRSVHYIVQIKNSWTETPNYRGLENIKAEIQIRTILMHAWAEIEHKLNYKSDSQVPSKFQRKLFRLSAKFEEADEQFEELRDGIRTYKQTIAEKAKDENKFDINQDFNLDSFIAFFQFHFPGKEPTEDIGYYFDDYVKYKISFKDMEYMLDKGRLHLKDIADDLNKGGYSHDLNESPAEFLGFLMCVSGKLPIERTVPVWKNSVVNWRKKIATN